MSLLDDALIYAEYGLAVFPLVPDSKYPLTKQGFKDATTDEKQIKEWWTKNPEANIGIATGHYSGNLVVIDLDIKDGAGGVESFEKWLDESYAYLPETPAVLTWSGGRHYYFRSRSNVPSRIGWLKGVDVRAEGGYVVAAGSVINGEPYEWAVSIEDVDIQSEEDDVWVSYLFDEIRKGSGENKPFHLSDRIEQGKRNETLYKMACSMQGKGNSDRAILAAVLAENNERCNPPLPEDEVKKIVKSALTKEKGKLPDSQQGEEQPFSQPSAPASKGFDFDIMKSYSARDLMTMDVKEPMKFIGVDEEIPLLSEGTCVLAAKAKAGKSWFCTNLCWALATGSDFLGFKTKKCKVQYYDLEQGKNIEKKRISMVAEALDEVPPEGFLMNTRLQRIEHGLIEQLEYDMQTNPDIGVFIIDVFEKVRTEKKQTETDYTYTYRDFGVMNAFAEKYHVSVILLFHSRKTIDPLDPFSDILGSTAIQGACSQMIVLTKDKYNARNTKLIAKGRTMDGIVEREYVLEKGICNVAQSREESAEDEALTEFLKSEIRGQILEFMTKTVRWKGKCSSLIMEFARQGIGTDADALTIGRFLSKNIGRLMKHDGIVVEIIKNGNGGNIYCISKHEFQPLITIDEPTRTIDENPFNPA